MNRALFLFLQWTWGILQNAAGAFLLLLHRNCPHDRYQNAVRTRWGREGSLSLGMFLFVGAGNEDWLSHHEYGHSLQSCILGPFFLPLIGLPSLVWSKLPACRGYRFRHRKNYYTFYTEAWANRLGFRREKEKSEA